MSGDAGALPECEVKKMMTPSRCAALGIVVPELVGLFGKAFARDATRRLRFDVHAVGRLHSTVAAVVVASSLQQPDNNARKRLKCV